MTLIDDSFQSETAFFTLVLVRKNDSVSSVQMRECSERKKQKKGASIRFAKSSAILFVLMGLVPHPPLFTTTRARETL